MQQVMCSVFRINIMTIYIKYIFNFILFASFIPFINCEAQTQSELNKIEWSELQEIPPGENMSFQPGLASPFAGVSDDVLIVIGGCNFPEDPVYEGGKKRYYQDIFILDKPSASWTKSIEFPYAVAYGASVTLDEGLLCIGGKNNNEEFDRVTFVKWNSVLNKIEFELWPELPFTMSQHTAAKVGNTIYVAGGTANNKLANKFLKLDLNKKNTPAFRWEELPDFPGPARLQAVGVGQNAAEEQHFYMMSGSSFPEDAIDPFITIDGLEYNPKTNLWSSISETKPKNENSISLHGAGAISMGVHHMIFVGGVNRQIFYDAWVKERKLKNAINDKDSILSRLLEEEIHQYFTLPPEDYQFNTKLLAYHTITDTWTTIGKYPFPAPAGAPLVKWKGGFVVVNGETKPGVRSPKVYFGKLTSSPDFGWLNWSILFIYLFGMLFLGYFFMKRESSTEDFFKGGGRIPWWAAGMSIFATMLSAITFMAIPAKTYATNWLYFMLAVTIFVMAFPVIKYYLPFFRRLKVTTAYEYLEHRFNYTIRLLASSLFIIFMIARMALVLFLPSLALTTVTGIDIYVCITLMGIITLIYCTMGGVEAVIWGDVIQGFVLLGGAFLAVLFLINGTEGGLSRVIDITISNEKMKTFDFAFDLTRATFWVVLLGGMANNLISYSSDQTVIQRYLTTKDERSAGKSIMLNGVLSIIVSVVFYFIGTGLYAYFTTNPEQLDIGMKNPDSIFPYFIMTNMPVGVAGLLISAIFAATMSTISSNINSMSTAFTADIYKKMILNKTDKHYLLIARISGIVLGAIGIYIAILMATRNILSLLDYFNYLLGLLASGLGGLFIMGIFIKRIDGRSALIGFVGGIILLLFFTNYTNIHFLLYGFIGISGSVIIALIISFILPVKKKNLDGLTFESLKENYE